MFEKKIKLYKKEIFWINLHNEKNRTLRLRHLAGGRDLRVRPSSWRLSSRRAAFQLEAASWECGLSARGRGLRVRFFPIFWRTACSFSFYFSHFNGKINRIV